MTIFISLNNNKIELGFIRYSYLPPIAFLIEHVIYGVINDFPGEVVLHAFDEMVTFGLRTRFSAFNNLKYNNTLSSS